MVDEFKHVGSNNKSNEQRGEESVGRVELSVRRDSRKSERDGLHDGSQTCCDLRSGDSDTD